MPFSNYREIYDYFLDFFPTQEEFSNWMFENILDSDEQDWNVRFLNSLYRQFERRYRNVIIYEQEYFEDDFSAAMVDNKRKLELLYQLWNKSNDKNVYDMIGDRRYEYRTHHVDERTDEDRNSKSNSNQDRNDSITSNNQSNVNSASNSESASTTDDNRTSTSLSRGNDGKLQSKLALSDLEIKDGTAGESKEMATSANVEKENVTDETNAKASTADSATTDSKAKTDTEGKYKTSQEEVANDVLKAIREANMRDELKAYNQNTADLIASFTKKRLTEGFKDFVNQQDFAVLFGRVNGGMVPHWSYRKTNWDDIKRVPIYDQPEDITTIITKTDIGFIKATDPITIARHVLISNPEAEENDFFVSNIFPEKNEAYLTGINEYKGIMKITFTH